MPRNKKAWEAAEKKFIQEYKALRSDEDKRKLLVHYSEAHPCSICGEPSDEYRSIPTLGYATEAVVEEYVAYGDDGLRLRNRSLCYDCAWSLFREKKPNSTQQNFERFFVSCEKPAIYTCHGCGATRVMFSAEVDFWQRGDHRICWRQHCTLTAQCADDLFICQGECHRRVCKAGQPTCSACLSRQAFRRGLVEQAEAKTKASIEAAKVEREERVRVAEKRFANRQFSDMVESGTRKERFDYFVYHQNVVMEKQRHDKEESRDNAPQ